MSERKWSYEPTAHTRDLTTRHTEPSDANLMEEFITLTEKYSEVAKTKRVLVLNDNKQTVFFVQLNDDNVTTQRVDVYIWDGHHYCLLPQHLATIAASEYFNYVDAMSQAYQWLEDERSE